MQKCWLADPEERPGFARIRSELSRLLECVSENYGYYKVLDGSVLYKDLLIQEI